MNPLLALLLRIPLHGLGLFVAALPRPVELSLGRFLGHLALAVDPKRRKIAHDNIRRCLPELGPAGWNKILRANYEHYGMLTLEIAHMFTPIAGHFRAYAARHARLEGGEHLRAACAKGKGVLFCSAHLANWELGAALIGQAGIPAVMVTRRLKPEWLHDWMGGVRLSVGIRCVYQPRTMPVVIKTLREGGIIGFVMDQYMPPPMGAPTRFFGVTVDTLAAIAPLARRTGAAILPVCQLRDADGTIRIVVEREFQLGDDDQSDNQRLADRVEQWIRAKPSQWLWAHRRFKNVDWSAVDRRTQTA